MARRPKVELLKWTPSDDGFEIRGKHDGDASLKSGAIHTRDVKFSANGSLVLTDSVEARQPCTSRSFLHFHPDVAVTCVAENSFCCVYGGVRLNVEYSGDIKSRLEFSEYFPRFGTRIDRTCLAVEAHGKSQRIVTQVTWA